MNITTYCAITFSVEENALAEQFRKEHPDCGETITTNGITFYERIWFTKTGEVDNGDTD